MAFAGPDLDPGDEHLEAGHEHAAVEARSVSAYSYTCHTKAQSWSSLTHYQVT